jgi:hypothetical protein
MNILVLERKKPLSPACEDGFFMHIVIVFIRQTLFFGVCWLQIFARPA